MRESSRHSSDQRPTVTFTEGWAEMKIGIKFEARAGHAVFFFFFFCKLVLMQIFLNFS